MLWYLAYAHHPDALSVGRILDICTGIPKDPRGNKHGLTRFTCMSKPALSECNRPSLYDYNNETVGDRRDYSQLSDSSEVDHRWAKQKVLYSV
jgi:hypothetical protein